MYYRESDTIAYNHIDLVNSVTRLDEYLYVNQGGPIRLSRTADFLNIGDPIVDNLLTLYETLGVVSRFRASICPRCDMIIEEEEQSSQLICDLCDGEFEITETMNEEAFIARKTDFECGDEISQSSRDGEDVEGVSKIIGCSDPARIGDVLFIHGLDGDAQSTWHPKNEPEKFWPKWLGEDIASIGVWSFGYEVSSSEWKGSAMPLTDRAINSLAHLEAAGIGQRPIVFITHSLGGLLVKQMLRHGCEFGNSAWQYIVDNTKGIIFLSTPHSGSDIANYVQYLSRILRQTVATDELKAHDPRLRELNIWFRNNAASLSIETEVFYEKRKMRGALVVSDTSADPGIPGVIPIPVDSDHAQICKPSSKSQMIYVRVKRFVEQCIIV